MSTRRPSPGVFSDGRPVRRLGKGARYGSLLVVLTGALVVSVVAAVGIGPVEIPFGEVWRIVAHRVAPALVSGTSAAADLTIVVDLRLPRVLLGAIVGAGLAVVAQPSRC